MLDNRKPLLKPTLKDLKWIVSVRHTYDHTYFFLRNKNIKTSYKNKWKKIIQHLDWEFGCQTKGVLFTALEKSD